MPVLCSILHLRHEETKVITELWAVKHGGRGLVGWLLPPAPPPVKQMGGGGGGAGVSTESMQMNRGGQGADAGGDVSYDPNTGAGIDINMY